MKSCPTCNRTFDDEALKLCPDDGSALTSYGALGGKSTWNPTQDQIAEIQQYVATTSKPKRQKWPLVVGIVVVALILIGLGYVFVINRM